MTPKDFKENISTELGGYPYLTKIYGGILDNIQRALYRILRLEVARGDMEK